MTKGFYKSFEDRFRGSRELIKDRLNIYTAFVKPLLAVYPDGAAFDIGCGRGEWLELLDEIGFQPKGIDLDAEMLEVCQDMGLHVELGDALVYLANLRDESQVIITAFHVVEHISFEELQNLVSESLRVLKPGGLLVLETPNPENLIVGAMNFYLDPTHQRPIPPQLLAFIPEYVGFERTKVLRLQESKELSVNPAPTLMGVLSGVSPDYAVIAQKGGSSEILDLLRFAFDCEYGLSLETLTNRYQERVEARAELTEARAQQAEARAQQAEARAERAEARAERAEARAERAEARAEGAAAKVDQSADRAEQAEAASKQILMQLDVLYNSTSWQITAPLRWLGDNLRRLLRTLKSKLKVIVRYVGQYVRGRPKLKRLALLILNRMPTLKMRLTRVAKAVVVAPVSGTQNALADLNQLTPHARQIFADLESTIKQLEIKL